MRLQGSIVALNKISSDSSLLYLSPKSSAADFVVPLVRSFALRFRPFLASFLLRMRRIFFVGEAINLSPLSLPPDQNGGIFKTRDHTPIKWEYASQRHALFLFLDLVF